MSRLAEDLTSDHEVAGPIAEEARTRRTVPLRTIKQTVKYLYRPFEHFQESRG
jgi:hypothetical protein